MNILAAAGLAGLIGLTFGQMIELPRPTIPEPNRAPTLSIDLQLDLGVVAGAVKLAL